MKKIFIWLVILLAAGTGLYYWNTAETQVEETAQYEDANLPLSFEYRTGPDGYVLLEQESNESQPNLIKTIILMHQDDYQSVLSGEREGGEGPPVISIQVYRNPLNLTPGDWVEQNPNVSNFPLIIGGVGSTTVDEREAVAYDADGLYPNQNIIFADGDSIYYVNGSYLDKDSDVYRDFRPFVNSIRLK